MSARPAWDWDLLDADDAVLDRPLSPAFSHRFDAETWLGENWRTLAEHGVVSARLMHHGHAAAPPLLLRKD